MKAKNKLDINQVTTMSRDQEKSYRSDHRICETTEHGFTSDMSTQMVQTIWWETGKNLIDWRQSVTLQPQSLLGWY